MRIRKIEDTVASTKTIDTLPIGTILPFGSSTIPTGWLLCDGSIISRTTYKPLFDIIGTSFGTGDGSTTFNLPNMKGKTIVGMDSSQTEFDTLGETGGEKTHKLSINEMPSHNHRVSWLKQEAGNDYQFAGGVGAWQTTGYTNQNISHTGGDQPHNNLQPYIVTNYIIKAEQTVGLTGVVTNIPSTSATDTYSCEYINNKEKVLYDNSSGSTAEITLNDDVSNYNYIEVICSNSGNCQSFKIPNAYGKGFVARSHYNYGTTGYTMVCSSFTITHTKISPVTSNCGYIVFNDTGLKVYRDGTNYNAIIKVIGYK